MHSNNYFANIGGNLASSIPSASKTANEFMPPPICNSLFRCPVTADEIQLEIAKLQTGKAVGPSSIPISVLKILKSELAGPLQVIFNTSFLTGIVPDKFKLARVNYQSLRRALRQTLVIMGLFPFYPYLISC